jgi:cell division protein FtsL
MVDCCELALANSRLALYIALGAFVTIALLLLMFFGYNLRLDKRTVKLEKKNGHEQKQLDELKKEIKKLKSRGKTESS